MDRAGTTQGGTTKRGTTKRGTTKHGTAKRGTTNARTTDGPATTKAQDTQGRIIAAAEEVVLRDGVAHLTLEAAAAEAGLSKGGVLYHFPTRDALVAGMVAKIIEEFDRDIEERLGEEEGPGRFLRAYIRATMIPSAVRPDREDRLGAALIAAAAAEPELLEPLREAADRWQARMVDDGLDPAVATVLRLACDGLWLCDLFGLAPPAAALRTEVGTELERMAAEAS